MSKPSIPKGTRDFLPSQMAKRNYIFDIARSVFKKFGFQQIETPAIENLSTLTGKYGDEGDQLMFKILNRGDKFKKAVDHGEKESDFAELALKYDQTVPLARFVAQHQNEIAFPFKRFQIQPVWRADRPGKGRYREFYQCDADVIGTDSLLCEVELVQLYDDVFTKLNIPNVDICINNRKVLCGMVELMRATDLFDDIVIALDKLDKIGIEKVKEEMESKGVKKESLSILDTFLTTTNVNDLTTLLENSVIGKKGLEELTFVMQNIEKLGLQSASLVFDITLARGLNYYTGCILEVRANDVRIGSIGGGGRYDDLTSIFGLKDVSGVGISFGIDRIYIVMEELGLFPKDIDVSTKVMFANFGEDEAAFCMPLLKQLRAAGISSEIYPKKAKMKKQMTYANNKGIQYVILVGEDEMASGILSIKNMESGEQSNLNITDLIKELS